MQKDIRFNINNKLAFIDSFQCLNFSLDGLTKTLGKDWMKKSVEKLLHLTL